MLIHNSIPGSGKIRHKKTRSGHKAPDVFSSRFLAPSKKSWFRLFLPVGFPLRVMAKWTLIYLPPMRGETLPDMPERENFYAPRETLELANLKTRVDALRREIDTYRPLAESDKWAAIQEKLRLEWTYESNAIEGNTLTKGETIFFLSEGLTVEGKPFKDFLDVRNHHEALEFLYEIIHDERPISEGLIKEINALLMKGVDYTEALGAHGQKVKKPLIAGDYKKLPNHVLQIDGTIYQYVEPVQVQSEMEYLCDWINQSITTNHPLTTAALAHYNMVRIHPFDDGNGRGARILMNLILIKKGYPPAVIKNTERRTYLMTLGQANQGDLNPFCEFIGKSLLKTQEMILEEMKK